MRRFEELMARVLVLGRARCGPLVRCLFGTSRCPAVETARLAAENSAFARQLIATANRLRHGAGIAATSLEAAVMRTGNERTCALLLTYEVGAVLANAVGGDVLGPYWDAAVVRGCLARAIAMNRSNPWLKGSKIGRGGDPAFARDAFLIGVLQDVASPLLAAAAPRESAQRVVDAVGAPLTETAAESARLGFTHVHAGCRLLRGMELPNVVVDAAGRHHACPPERSRGDSKVRLWQIAYVVGSIPRTPTALDAATRDALLRILSDGDDGCDGPASRLSRQAREEYEDIAEMFSPFAPPGSAARGMLAAVQAMLGGGSVAGKDFTCVESNEARLDRPTARRSERLSESSETPPFIATIS